MSADAPPGDRVTCRFGWLSTGRDEAARQLLFAARTAIGRGEIPGETAFVFSNREWGEDRESDLFLQQVQSYGIPLLALSSRRFQGEYGAGWREEYDQRVISLIVGFQPVFCVLAGYMLIVTPRLCRRFPLVNLHPALPGGPRGTWQEVVWQLMERRAEGSGVMMHLVTPELDSGPPLTFCHYSLRGEPFDPYWKELRERPLVPLRDRARESHPLFQLIRREGLRREFPLILATLRALCSGEVRIEGEQVVDERGNPLPGYDLTSEVERAIAGGG